MRRTTLILLVSLLLLIVPIVPSRLHAGTVPCPRSATGPLVGLSSMILPNAFGCPDLVGRGPIAINSDSDFTSANGVTGGSGTASDPYIISGWDIEFNWVSAQISISNTRAFFVLRNVTAGGVGDGIVLNNVANGRLENLGTGGGSVPGDSGVGIRVTGSNHVWIVGVQESSTGTRNEGGGGPGTIISSSSNIFISNNVFGPDVYYVVSISGSINVTVVGNHIYGGDSYNNQGYGLDLAGSTNVTVSGNSFQNTGLLLGGTATITSDNTVNGRPLYYYHNCNNLTLNNVPVGQLIIDHCSDVHLSSLNINNTDVGITMTGVTNALVENIELSANHFAGLQLASSSNVTIRTTDFSGMLEYYVSNQIETYGLIVNSSNKTVVDGNRFYSDDIGVEIGISSDNTFSGNTFDSNLAALRLEISTPNTRLYHNNFLPTAYNSLDGVSDSQPGHSWDNGYPSGGNFWANYPGSDPDNDGIGDTPYPIPGGVYQDRYPLMRPYPSPNALTADFTFSPSNPMVGQTVTFRALSVGGVAPYSYSWNFGDGSTGSGGSATHSYSSRPPGGGYTVTLTVTDSATPAHAKESASHFVTVTSPPPPLIDSFTATSSTASSTSAAVEQWVRFDASASGGTSPYNYSWNFGDGTAATGLEVFHIYCSAGIFTVVLTVRDSGSPQQTATAQKTFTATSPPTSCVTASITYSPSSPNAGQNVTFTGTISGGTPPYNSYYVFGDNPAAGPVGGPTATHIFSSPGSFNVEFHVTDSSSGDIVIGQIITVTNADPTVGGTVVGVAKSYLLAQSISTILLVGIGPTIAVAILYYRRKQRSKAESCLP